MLGKDYVNDILVDGSKEPINKKLETTLKLLEKLTLRPSQVGPEDIKPLKEAGISHQAIEDAIYVCAYFNIIDRIADSLDFDIPSQEKFASMAGILLKRGYK